MSKILIIDDDEVIQKLFSQYLKMKGHEVIQAQNGKIGMQLIEEDCPDLIITDILMPEMDGLEVLIKIRHAHENIPIIAISGGTPGLPIDFLHQAKLIGARDVFKKPVQIDVLYNAVTDLLKLERN
ncbi:MAG: DNA-binding NtrC family response regulator [Candidatus Pelagisphaera sp.]|jgi:DNA-binding NtrC family response regulator